MTRPTPAREHTITGLLREYQNFADLLSVVDTSMWRRPTRCLNWEVRDVAAHVVAQARDAVTGKIGSRSPDDQAASLRHHPPEALAAQLLETSKSTARVAAQLDDDTWFGPSPLAHFTVGQGFHALVLDAYVHGDDIRDAVGLPFDPGPGVADSVDFLLGELSRDPVAAGHPRIEPLLALPAQRFQAESGIDAHDFILVATGRLDPRTFDLPGEINVFGT